MTLMKQIKGSRKMITYLDKTFCASPNCTNECGRKMTEIEMIKSTAPGQFLPICYGYFCGKEVNIQDEKLLK